MLSVSMIGTRMRPVADACSHAHDRQSFVTLMTLPNLCPELGHNSIFSGLGSIEARLTLNLRTSAVLEDSHESTKATSLGSIDTAEDKGKGGDLRLLALGAGSCHHQRSDPRIR
jgi:hypothetical protein